MHLAYCDALGPKGPEDPKALELSRLVSVAVDFAKHGKCVSKEEYAHIKVDKHPDFMEKDTEGKESYLSQSINGILYRQVDTEMYYEACISHEHKFSIKLEYAMNNIIIKKDTTFHKYLKDVYVNIVLPLEEELKGLMFDFTITNEAELYCSEFSFKMNDASGEKYIGDPASKPEDSVNKLNARLTDIKKRYEGIMQEMDNFSTSEV